MELSQFIAAYGAAFVWLFVAVAALFIESQTCELVSIWFVPGALAAMISSLIVDWKWLQTTLFLSISFVMLFLMKTVFKKYLPQSKPSNLNADSLIGATAVVEEEIDNVYGKGSVKVKGLVWSARSADDAVKIPAGALVTVREIAGVKLICEEQINH